MSAMASSRTERAQPGKGDALDAAGAQALIAEARAHARRRRLRRATVLAVAVLTAAGALIGWDVTRSHPGPGPDRRPAVATAVTGVVTGHLDVCSGLPPQPGQRPITPGTVLALRGTVSWKQTGPGAWQAVFPGGPAVASEHISNNYGQTFRFALPAGRYVLAGRYDESGEGTFGTFRNVTITAGATIRVDLPNVCS